jgi:cell wall assembly regulator SMI1
MADFADALRTFEAHLAAHAPLAHASLRAPATPERIADAEQRLGLSFPEPLRQLYLRHDGQENEVTEDGQRVLATGAFNHCRWLPLRSVLSDWQLWNDLLECGDIPADNPDADAERCQPVWWSPSWIPISHDYGGNYECVDLDPGPMGQVGQIVYMDHECGGGGVLAPDLATWIEELIAEWGR